MKKLIYSLFTLGGLLVSCSSEEIVLPNGGEEVQATFTINVPQSLATRGTSGTSSAQGGYSNAAGELNYTVALLNKKDGTVVWSSNTPDSKNANQATFTPTVVLGYTYQIVAYATFGDVVDAPVVGSVITDGTSLANITTGKGINDETEDAYFVNDDILGAAQMQATLKRPFGKLRLVAEDYAQIAALGLSVESVKVTYKAAPETTFNVLSKNFTNSATSSEFVDAEENAYSNEEDRKEYTVFVDYLPAPTTGETFYSFDIEVTYADGKGTYTRSFTQDIPVKRNGLTTLRGNFFTTNAALTLIVDDNFDSEEERDIEYTYYTVSSAEELAVALTATDDNIYVKLAANVDLPISSLGQQTAGTGEYRLGGTNTQNIVIDLQGNKLNVTTTYWSGIGAKNNNATITILNGTMTSSQEAGTWNSYDVTFANCNYVIKDIVFEKAIAFTNDDKSVTLNNVTINESHDYYAMWVNAGGQTLNIDGLTVNSNNGRGIKIDEEYNESDAAKVTMNISNSKFTTAKKSAVMVKSHEGAEINWGSGNDISNVAADNVNAVWVDEDADEYANLVVVNGASKIIEGKTTTVTSQSDFESAITNPDVSMILLDEGTYELPKSVAGKTITFAGVNKETSIVKIGENNTTSADGSIINFENCTVVRKAGLSHNEGTYDQFTRAKQENYTNCIINGKVQLAVTESATFTNCQFVNTVKSGFDGYSIFYYGYSDSKVYVNNCTFNTVSKAIVIYSEGAVNYDLTVNDSKFVASEKDDKAAIQMHTEYGISGVVRINNSTATGFDETRNGGLWWQGNNNTQVVSTNFDIYLDGELMPENPIVSAEQLAAMGDKNAVGTYTLVADIDMTGVDMKPIMLGNGTLTINGNNHTIRNLKLVQSYQNGMWVSGLLNVMHSGSSLNVSNLTIDGVTSISGNYSSAVVAYNSRNGVTLNLSNVDVKNATIEGKTVAALVGYTVSPVNLTNCDVASLSLTGEAQEKVGAYIGTANGSDCVVTISNCTNNTSYNNVGRVINGATSDEK